MRRLGTLGLLLAVSAALLACGKGQPKTGSTAATGLGSTGSGSPGAAKLSRSQYAAAVNLSLRDLPPGFHPKHQKQRSSPAEKHLEQQALQCVSPQADEKGVDFKSPEFESSTEGRSQEVESEVSFARSAAVAKQELATIRGKHARDCLAHFIGRLLKRVVPQSTTVGAVRISPGTPPASGTDGGFAWRVSTELVLHSIPVHIYLDVFGFVIGRTEVTLRTLGLPLPVSSRLEEQLFSTLLARAKAHHV